MDKNKREIQRKLRILLYPIHMPTVQSCGNCNNGFSDDEEYLACFIECVVCGATDPENPAWRKFAKF